MKRVLTRGEKYTFVDVHATGNASQRHASTHSGGASLADTPSALAEASSVTVRLATEKGRAVGKGTRLTVLGVWGPNVEAAPSWVQAEHVKFLDAPPTGATAHMPGIGAPEVYPGPFLQKSPPGATPLMGQTAPAPQRLRHPQGKPPVIGQGAKLGVRVATRGAAPTALPVSPPAPQLWPPTREVPEVERAAAPGPQFRPPTKEVLEAERAPAPAPQPAKQRPPQQAEKVAASGRAVVSGSRFQQSAQPAAAVVTNPVPARILEDPAGEVPPQLARAWPKASAARPEAVAPPAGLPRHAVQVVGVVTRVVYHNADNGYTVLRVHAPDAPPPPPALLEVARAAAQAAQAKGGDSKWQNGARGTQRRFGRRRGGVSEAPKGEVAVVGSFFGAAAGQRYKFHGCWETSKFGLQLGALHSEELAPETLSDISRYASGNPSPVRHFGSRCLSLARTSADSSVLLPSAPGHPAG